MKEKKILLLLIACSLLLSGCWDESEPERLVYANGLGVDYKDGKIIIYMQIINLSGLAQSEGGGGGATSKADVGRAEGKTIEEATFNLYHTLDRRLYWGHLSFVVLSEEAIKAGILQQAADFIDRYRETRYRMYFFVTQDSLKEILLMNPIESISLAFSKLSDPDANYRQSSFIEAINLRELIIDLDEPAHQAKLPIIKLSNQWSAQDEPRKEPLIESAAVVSDHKLIGILPKHIMNGARLVNKNFARDSVSLSSNKNTTTSVLVYDKKVKIKPVVEKNGKVRFHIKMKLNANAQTMTEKKKRKELENELKQAIHNEVYKTYHFTRKKGIDIFKLSQVLYRDNNKAWKRIQKNGEIPLEEDTIKSLSLDIKFKNSGKVKLTPLFDEEEKQ
ncbi:Ger(x)C family spore germination protein [Peribacillus asahii]|uniref:Ger(x)C family spore germination protein n=1 Tax=Peribacillus asahii TaxID=228899 RepID=UPI002079504C|nr:Ger(x)C family spore germination protein [Peribacillus asahii]USK71225.1 Ger(x)C family spore germination protein [Peribacillus asahii]